MCLDFNVKGGATYMSTERYASCRLTRVMSLIPLQLEKNRIPCTKEASFYEIYSEGLCMLEPMSLFVNLHLLH